MNPLLAPVAPQGLMPSQAGPQGTPGAPMAPQAAQGQPMDPMALQQAHDHLNTITSGLTSLIAQKPGTLTKQDVFATAADMIKSGAFPDPAGRQKLITELAQLPDDEGAIRMYLGSHLMNFAGMQTRVKAALGAQQGG